MTILSAYNPSTGQFAENDSTKPVLNSDLQQFLADQRSASLPSASGKLFGGQVVAGSAVPVTVGTGLLLTNGVLTTGLSGISIDGTTIVASTGSPYQMLVTDRVVDVNKSTGAATKILLPTNPTLWVDYTIIDGKGDAGTNGITVVATGGTINGLSQIVIQNNNGVLSVKAVSATTWRIV